VLAAQGVVYVSVSSFSPLGRLKKVSSMGSAHRKERKHKFAIKNFPQHCPRKKSIYIYRVELFRIAVFTPATLWMLLVFANYLMPTVRRLILMDPSLYDPPIAISNFFSLSWRAELHSFNYCHMQFAYFSNWLGAGNYARWHARIHIHITCPRSGVQWPLPAPFVIIKSSKETHFGWLWVGQCFSIRPTASVRERLRCHKLQTDAVANRAVLLAF